MLENYTHQEAHHSTIQASCRFLSLLCFASPSLPLPRHHMPSRAVGKKAFAAAACSHACKTPIFSFSDHTHPSLLHH